MALIDEASLEGVLWLVMFSGADEVGIVGIFTSEEKATASIDECISAFEGTFWICPLDLDVVVDSENDRFSQLPDRICPVFSVSCELEQETEYQPPRPPRRDKVDRKGLKVIK